MTGAVGTVTLAMPQTRDSPVSMATGCHRDCRWQLNLVLFIHNWKVSFPVEELLQDIKKNLFLCLLSGLGNESLSSLKEILETD